MDKKTVRDIAVGGRRVLVRVDLNVPLDIDSGAITDDTRIRAVLPTINYLIESAARVILCSHLGRPKGKVVAGLSLKQVAERLSSILGRPVAMAGDCVGAEVEAAANDLKDGDVMLLENLRFHPQEEANDPQFAAALARLADVYVNDAFGTAHRAHASTVGVAGHLPAVAGFLMEKEISVMDRALNHPARPFTTIIGGAKISDKISVLEHIMERVDTLLIGGGMASNFIRAMDYGIGDSLIEPDRVELARELMERARQQGIDLLLPDDVVVSDRFAADARSQTVPISGIPDGWRVMDIGPLTVEQFEARLRGSKTVIWNGPMGVFEYPRFSQGTKAMANTLAALDATTVIGGGSTAEAVEEMGLSDRMTHVSTGGGASLEFLEGKTLPGVAVLQDREG